MIYRLVKRAGEFTLPWEVESVEDGGGPDEVEIVYAEARFAREGDARAYLASLEQWPSPQPQGKE